MNELNDTLVVCIIGLLTLGLGYFTYFLSRYTDKLDAQIKNIKDEGQRKLFENALSDFHDIVLKTVTMAEQVSVKELKAKSEDGKLTKDDIVKIGEEVLAKVMENLSNNTKNVLDKNIVNLEEYAKSAIETKVFDMKK